MQDKKVQRAVIVGGSIAGMVAARVLSDFCEEVLLLERDPLSPESDNIPPARRGLPHGHHTHLLLDAGRERIEKWFPGFFKELTDQGAVKADSMYDLAWYYFGTWKLRQHSGMPVYFQNRFHLEGHLRRRLEKITNISLLSGVKVFGLEGNSGRINAVQSSEGIFRGDLIVDASGRSSPFPTWLKKLGCSLPEEQKLFIGISYLSQLYLRKPEHEQQWRAIAIYPLPPQGQRSGIILPIVDPKHGPCWLATVMGRNGDLPHADEKGFLEFTRGLEHPEIYNCVSQWQPVGTLKTYKFQANRRRHYEKMDGRPHNLLVLGDAYGHCNPIFGQGMSIACIQADILGQSLKQHNDYHKAVAAYFLQMAKFYDIPWRLINNEDRRYPQCQQGKKPPSHLRLVNAYTAGVHQYCSCSRTLALTLMHVLHLKASPLRLFHPGIALRIAWHSLKRTSLSKKMPLH